ncbi:WbqC family protein [Aeromicrobium sp. Root472D3]|uniref:WbqC family protein n=1 Tax=Aeromicrobium sp. Root472D3 TaxID=1736540 RepID=UPI0006FF01B3|nr:WbqC family protein [Aeromicrobium sp. Root472D3]KQX75831.1 hypothetical protein ASD10_11985 [Aeromicrobium sp. Root472D3]
MIVASRPADLLPCSTFWHEMATSDLFELEVDGRFRPGGHHCRVAMRGTWAVVPVLVCGPGATLDDVMIDPVEAPRALAEIVRRRYRSAPRWRTMGPLVTDVIDSIATDRLWELNVGLVAGVRELLGISTPVRVARRGERRPHRIGDALPVPSRHRVFTEDSVLTLLMDHDDPMDLVLAEHELYEEIRA